ncbi:MAG: hypothetical protein CMM07_28300 [Rhodopirellula sp.]|nr:hypothetical protein [Rhodopirellula sp.]
MFDRPTQALAGIRFIAAPTDSNRSQQLVPEYRMLSVSSALGAAILPLLRGPVASLTRSTANINHIGSNS